LIKPPVSFLILGALLTRQDILQLNISAARSFMNYSKASKSEASRVYEVELYLFEITAKSPKSHSYLQFLVVSVTKPLSGSVLS